VVEEETLRREGQESPTAETNEGVRRLERELQRLRDQLHGIVEQFRQMNRFTAIAADPNTLLDLCYCPARFQRKAAISLHGCERP